MKYFNRRFLLQGMGGIALGLPFLEGMVPRAARAQGAVASKRVLVMFEVNGVKMDTFFPKATATGAITDAMLTGTALEALIPHKAKLLIPRGFDMSPQGFQGVGCDHQKGMGHKLTASPLAGGNNYPTGISVDQAIAAAKNPLIGGPGSTLRRAAVTLGVGQTSSDVLGYISYTAPGTPLAAERNPWYAFRNFMTPGGTGTGADAGMQPAMIDVAARRKSVIDLVRDDFDNLKTSKLSVNDRAKLDMHLTIIRQLEMSMPIPPADAGMGGMAANGCSFPTGRTAEIQAFDGNTAVASGLTYERVGQMHMDILALAVACNYTVAGSLLFGRGSGGPVYNWINPTLTPQIRLNHHPLSHRSTTDAGTGGNEAEAEPQLFEIDKWHARQFAYMLSRLNAYTEANGTVLDNTAALWINELSDGQAHDYRDLPIVIGGGLGGYLKQGQYVNVKVNNGNLPHNMLLTTLMNGVGIPTTHFGAAGGNSRDGEVASIKV